MANTRQPTILQKLFGVDHQTSSFSEFQRVSTFDGSLSLVASVRDDSTNDDQRKNTRKIAANLTPAVDEPTASPAHKLQTQLSVQDTIQRHFCQILKNDSLTVTDQTSITETLLMRETSSTISESSAALLPEGKPSVAPLPADLNPLTPPMSNDDENKRPSANKSIKTPSTDKEKKGQVQYRILQRGQPDEPTVVATTPKKLQQESNAPDSTSSSKSQRNRRKSKRRKFLVETSGCSFFSQVEQNAKRWARRVLNHFSI